MAGLLGNPISSYGWTNGVDANNLTSGIIYTGNNCVNNPSDHCLIFTMGFGDRAQIAIPYGGDALFFRSTVPGDWRRLDGK